MDKAPIRLVYVLILLYAISVVVNLGSFNLTGEEPRRALVTIEMMESNDYVVPHVLGLEYYNKPPVYNWLLASFSGVSNSTSEFTLRLPSLIFLLLWAFIHYRISRNYFSCELALLSAFFLLTSADLYFYFLSSGAEIDIVYSFVVYLQALSIFIFYEKRKWWSLFLVSWLCCAIGFLIKGFPSLVFQFMTMLAICVQARSFRILFRLEQIAGFGMFVFLTGIYFFIYNQKNDAGVFLINLINESLKKSAIGDESTGKLLNVLRYPVILIKLLAPWCFFLLLLITKKKLRLLDNPLVKFSVYFIVFNIAVYWISGVHKIRYIYMFIPFAMNIIVYLIYQFDKQHPGRLASMLKHAGILPVLFTTAYLAVPFYFDLNLPFYFFSLVLLLGLIYFYFRKPGLRLWLFVSAIILLRLIYAFVFVPERAQKAFDYKPWMEKLAQLAKNEPVWLWHPADTLKFDRRLNQLLPVESKRVRIVPAFLYHQVPYYYYRFSGQLMRLDTALRQDRLYITYKRHLKTNDIDQFYSFRDGKDGDSLVLFRLKNGTQF